LGRNFAPFFLDSLKNDAVIARETELQVGHSLCGSKFGLSQQDNKFTKSISHIS